MWRQFSGDWQPFAVIDICGCSIREMMDRSDATVVDKLPKYIQKKLAEMEPGGEQK